MNPNLPHVQGFLVQGNLDRASRFALTAEKKVICQVDNFEGVVLCFMAACYVFMFEYPPSVQSVCTYLQRCLLEIHDGRKLPVSLIRFINKIEEKKVEG